MKDPNQPITFLHAEPCTLTATDEAGGQFSQEIDTEIKLSGDSDTI
jgi:hypothetical protein